MEFEIPKEIKSKPKLFGLEAKELIVIIVGSFFVVTILGNMVHGFFKIPFFIICAIGLFWMVLPSRTNPHMKNYTSILLYFKRDKSTYHALDTEKKMNNAIYREGVR